METELKLRFLREDGPKLLDEDMWLRDLLMPGSLVTKDMASIYYDTRSHALQSLKASLRVRVEGDDRVITVKRDDGFDEERNGLHQRMEWSVTLDDDTEIDTDLTRGFDTDAFMRYATSDGDPDESLLEVMDLIEDKPLVEVCRADFVRRSAYVGYGDTLMEMSLDTGELSAGDRSEAFQELEIELKEGDARDLFALGEEMLARFPVAPETRSKYGRCLSLRGHA